MGDVANYLAAGTVGGATQVVVGYPFDTIKEKLQSQPTPPPGQLPRLRRRRRCRQADAGRRGAPGPLQWHGCAARHRRRIQCRPLHSQGPDGGRAALRARRAKP